MKRSKSKNLYFKQPFKENILDCKTEKKKKTTTTIATNAKKQKVFSKSNNKKAANCFGLQSNPFAIIEAIEE